MSKKLTILYNAINQSIIHQKIFVKVPANKQLESFLTLLSKEGFICDFEIMTNQSLCKKYYKFKLLYNRNGLSVLSRIYSISKVNRKIFLTLCDLQKINKATTILILSTTHGLMTATEALQKKQGGELICILL